jgi:hypothetical protein
MAEFLFAGGGGSLALAHYPKLKDPEAVRKIAERIGEEDPQEYFVRRSCMQSQWRKHIPPGFRSFMSYRLQARF